MAADADAADGIVNTADQDVVVAEPSETSGGAKRGKAALAVGLSTLAVLLGLGAWMGYQGIRERSAAELRAEFVEAGSQAGLDLTTISFESIDADLARILESSTGEFRDDFASRSKPFADVVRQARSTSQGTVLSAGMESQSGDRAQVLVAVSVKTTLPDVEDQTPRAWRMRIAVAKVGDTVKVSDVQFVP